MAHKIIDLCLKNRILVLIFFGLLISAGWWAMKNTPIDAIPDIGENQVVVFAEWKGRSPRDIEDQVIYPLSVVLLGIPDVEDVRSTSMFSFGYVNVIFKEHVDFYWARTRVMERLNTAIKDMPVGVVPTLGPDATGIGQIFWYTVENGYYCPEHTTDRYANGGKCPHDGKDLIPSRLDLHELRSLHDWTIRYFLASANGVSEVASVGGYVKQYQIDIDPDLLFAHNVSLSTVYNAVTASNIDIAAKVIEESSSEILIRSLGFIKSIEEIENIVVTERNGVPVYVRNLGTVGIGPDFRRGALDKEGVPATGGVVLMRQGGNPLRIIRNIKMKIAEITPGLPPGVRIVPFYDRSELIGRATDMLKETLIDEMAIASIVLIVFLGQISSSLIVAIILPISILLTFLGMKLIGLQSNIMSMSGIAIAIGVMVDAGIVMTENIMRLLREPHGNQPKITVVSRAAKEVAEPILFAMLIIIVAFVPVFSLTGQAGKLFKPLAFTKTLAMISAAIVAIALIPVLASIFMISPAKVSPTTRIIISIGYPIRKIGDNVTWLLQKIYEPIIRLVMRNSWTKSAVIVLAIASVIVSIPLTPLGKKIGQEFMPPLNEGDLLFMPVLLPGASITLSKDILTKQDKIMSQFPEVKTVVGKLGRAETATDPAPIGMFETIVALNNPNTWDYRTVKIENLPKLISLISSQIKPKSKAVLAKQRLLLPLATKIDEFAVKFHNPNVTANERKKLYRIWLIQLISAEISDPSTPETELTKLSLQFADQIDHRQFFRRKTRTELINDLIEACRMPGVSPIMTQPIRNRIDMLATGIQTPIGIKVFGTDLKQIEAIAIRIEQELAKIGGAKSPYAERIGNKPHLEFHTDREEAARYGIQIGTIQRTIMTAIGGMNLTTTVEGRERYPIRVRYKRELRDNVSALEKVLVPTPKGIQIPLGQVAKIQRGPGPAKIASENTILFSRVFCDVDVEKVGLVDFVETIEKMLHEKIKPDLPAGYFYAISGQYEAEIEARNRLTVVVPICIILIFVLLYIKFRSVPAMLSIFLAIPFAFVGGIWLQWLLQFIPSVIGGGYVIKYSTAVWVGYVALFGVAVEDGIVLVEYLLERVKSGEPIEEATINACLLRVRPIIMTTATTVIAILPIMLYEVSTATGAELMKPIAVPTFGGMITATIANLILVPVLFSMLQSPQNHQSNVIGK